jgi:hypothetical protein
MREVEKNPHENDAAYQRGAVEKQQRIARKRYQVVQHPFP